MFQSGMMTMIMSIISRRGGNIMDGKEGAKGKQSEPSHAATGMHEMG